jgi:hypothetical protein
MIFTRNKPNSEYKMTPSFHMLPVENSVKPYIPRLRPNSKIYSKSEVQHERNN